MKRFFPLLWLTTWSAQADEPGSQYQQAAEAGDELAQYYLTGTWFSTGDLSKAEFWAQKSADSHNADVIAHMSDRAAMMTGGKIQRFFDRNALEKGEHRMD